MADIDERHRPIMAGISLRPYGADDRKGTIGAIARKSNGELVLVTAAHVVVPNTNYTGLRSGKMVSQGGDHHDDRVAKLYTDNGVKSWVVPAGSNAYDANAGDYAALEMIDNVQGQPITARWDLHEHDADGNHIQQPLVKGAFRPQMHDVLTMFGASSGTRPNSVVVTDPKLDPDEPVIIPGTGGRYFFVWGTIEMNVEGQGAGPGDSGSGLFIRDSLGNWRIVGILISGRGGTASAIPAHVIEERLNISFGVERPIAHAGDDVTVRPGELVDLSGAASTSNETGAFPLEYYWEPDPHADPPIPSTYPSSANFSTSAAFTFHVPSDATTSQAITYRLMVKDRYGAKSSATVTVTVNNPPSANVAQEVVTAYRGDTVELNGSGSSDPDGHSLTYSWEQTGVEEPSDVPTVTITNSDEARASFVAPDYIGRLSFSLTVTDEMGATDSAEVYVTVRNRSPIAHAGPNRVINATNEVTLEGSVSDPDPIDRNYVTDNHTWTQDSGPETITLDPVADEPVHRTFTPDVVGEYFFTLTATDKEPLSDSDTVRVSVLREAQNVLPTEVSASPSARSVDISWDELSIAAGYEVEIGIPASAGGLGHTSHTTTGTSITIPSLIPQKTYEYRVRMTNAEGVGPWTAWATVVTPGETPPTPTSTQWEVRYWGRKIQVMVKEIPTLIPAIDQVQAKLSINSLGAGLGSELTTVEKYLGTTLNEWVDVLTSTDTDWQTGTWAAQIRFENDIGDPAFATPEPVTVEYLAPTADAGGSRLSYLGERVLLDGFDSTANEPGATIASYQWSFIPDPNDQSPGPTPSRGWNRASLNFTGPTEPTTWRFRLTVTDSNGLTASAEIEVEFIRLPAPGRVSATATDTTAAVTWRAVYGATGYEVEIGASRTNTTTHTATGASITIEGLPSGTTHEYRVRATNGDAKGEWSGWKRVATTGTTTTTTTTDPEPITTEWEDVDPAVYEGCGPNRRKQQTRLLLGVREYRYKADPEELEWTDWADVTPEEILNRVEGGWTDTGNTQQDPVDDSWEKEQTRTVTYQKKQFSQSQCADQPLKYSWLSVSNTETRWVPLTTEPAPTTAPSNIRVTSKTHNSVTIAWNTVTSATGYTVELGIPPSAGGLSDDSDTARTTSITISNLLPLTTYRYRVNATNAGGPGPWSAWATVVTKGQRPPKPTSDQWNFRYSSNKLQAEVISLPTVSPVVTEVELTMETGQPPNLNMVVKTLNVADITIGEYTTVLTNSQTGWTTGMWIAQIRFRNSVDYGPYSDVKSDTVPTVPRPPDPPDPPVPPPVTHSYRDITPAVYSGCGPSRRRKQECVRLGHEDTNWRAAPEEYRWGRWYNTEHERNKIVGPWRNTSNYRGCGSDRERQQAQTITWENEQERQSHCGHTESRWQPASTTDTRWVDAPQADPWGSWRYTGGTDYDDIEDVMYYEQERFSYPCNRRDTRWVTTRP